MKLLVYLVIFFLLLNGFATAQTLIRYSCKKAADGDPNMKSDFCVKSLEDDPASRNATSLQGLLLASTKNSASRVKTLRGFVANILKGTKYKKGSKKRFQGCLKLCLELYSYAHDSLNEVLTDLKSRDYVSANVHLGAAFDAPFDCEDGFKETKQLRSPLTKYNDVLSQTIMIPLAFSNMLH